MKMLKNKKGEEEQILMNEMIHIIVSAICIGALIYLAVLIYFNVTTNQAARQAAAVMNGANGIEAEIKRINAGGEDNNSFFVPNPSGWFIFSFTGNRKPNQCARMNCICICQDVGFFIFFDREAELLKNCDNKGSCAIVENLAGFDKIKIEGGGIFISIKKVNGLIEIKKV